MSQNSTKNAKNLTACGDKKMLKSRKSAVTKKFQKLAGPLSQKIEKMHRSVVLQKCLKLAKNAKNSQVHGQGKRQKLHRSAVMQKSLKLPLPLSQNDTKNAKNSWVRGRGKMPKVAGPA